MKNKIKSVLLASIIVILLTVSACSANSTNTYVVLGSVTDFRPAVTRPLGMNEPAPDFQFTNAAGEILLFSDFKDKVVLLNFWAVDCPYCVQEMPLLEQVSRDWRDRGLVVLGVNTGEAESKVARFVSQRSLTFDIILDPDVYASTVYQAMYLPTTYIIDKSGNIVEGKIGAFTSELEIINMVKPYLD